MSQAHNTLLTVVVSKKGGMSGKKLAIKQSEHNSNLLPRVSNEHNSLMNDTHAYWQHSLISLVNKNSCLPTLKHRFPHGSSHHLLRITWSLAMLVAYAISFLSKMHEGVSRHLVTKALLQKDNINKT